MITWDRPTAPCSQWPRAIWAWFINPESYFQGKEMIVCSYLPIFVGSPSQPIWSFLITVQNHIPEPHPKEWEVIGIHTTAWGWPKDLTLEENHRIGCAIFETKNETTCITVQYKLLRTCMLTKRPNNKEYSESLDAMPKGTNVFYAPQSQQTIHHLAKRLHCGHTPAAGLQSLSPLSWDVYFSCHCPFQLFQLKEQDRSSKWLQIESPFSATDASPEVGPGSSPVEPLSRGAMASMLQKSVKPGQICMLSTHCQQQTDQQTESRLVSRRNCHPGVRGVRREEILVVQFGFYSQVAAYYFLPRSKFTSSRKGGGWIKLLGYYGGSECFLWPHSG